MFILWNEINNIQIKFVSSFWALYDHAINNALCSQSWLRVLVCAVHGQQRGPEMGQSRTKRHVAPDRFRAISLVALTSRRDIPEVINVGRKSRTRSVAIKEHLLPWTVIGFLSIMTRTLFNWRNGNVEAVLEFIDLSCSSKYLYYSYTFLFIVRFISLGVIMF